MRHWNSCLKNAYEQLWSNTCLCFCFLFDWSINDDITSAHYVSTLYNQRRHIFRQDICKKVDIDVIPQTWGEINWRLQWSTPAIAEKNGRHQTWRGNVEDHRKSIMFSWCEKHLYIQNCAEIRLITADLQIYTQYSRCKCFFLFFLFVWLCHGRNVWSWAKRKLSEKPGILRGYFVVL